jgi:RNA 2',3'-cyclic 3'-phosphodiesterase
MKSSQTRHMRAFVAIEIPDPKVIGALVEAQERLSATGADLKLVEKENLHFTIKFLGEISEAQGAEADSRLKGLALRGPEVEVKGLGAFPSVSRPSVVWVGVAPGDEAPVESIASSVIHALEGIGEKDSRPYRAHLTLARVRSGRNMRLLAPAIRADSGRSFGKVTLSSLKLKSSKLTPAGPVYSDIGEYPLR